MSTKNGLCLVSIALIIMFLLGSNFGSTQLDSKLDQQIGEIPALHEVTTEQAVLAVLSLAHISGGVVEVLGCKSNTPTSPKHSFALAGLTVRKALDLIIMDDPAYRWAENGNVVNVVPASGLPDTLKIKLPHFKSEPGSLIIDVGPKLFQTPEVKQVLSELGMVEEDPLQVMFTSGDRHLAREIALDHTTVINVLNIAAMSYSRPAVWKYIEHRGQCKQSYYLSWPIL